MCNEVAIGQVACACWQLAVVCCSVVIQWWVVGGGNVVNVQCYYKVCETADRHSPREAR